MLEFSFDQLAAKLKELAYLNSGLEIVIFDERTDRKQVFKFDGGIATYVADLNANMTAGVPHDLVHGNGGRRRQRRPGGVHGRHRDAVELDAASDSPFDPSMGIGQAPRAELIKYRRNRLA